MVAGTQRAMTAREWGLLALLSLLLGRIVLFRRRRGQGAAAADARDVAGRRRGRAALGERAAPRGFAATVFLHERPMARQFLGFALIALGLAFIDGRLPRALISRANRRDRAARDFRLPMDPKPR